MNVRNVWLSVVFVLSACSQDSGQGATPAGTRAFGDPCTKTEDCKSLLCIRVGPAVGVCTKSCNTESECPAASNWGCVRPDKFEADVCDCIPDAPEEICGDGIDNDCDGEIDDCLVCDGVAVPKNTHDHCGDCATACRADQMCLHGACTCDLSTPTACGHQCVDLTHDEANCGQCGQACPSGAACAAGACACASSTASACGAACVETVSDHENCGACGNACGIDQNCVAGACACNHAGWLACGTSCVDPSDPSHCGGCATACSPGEVCDGTSCLCASGLHCNGACVGSSDPANCGSCGHACGSSQNCTSGQCTCTTTGQKPCGTACVVLSTDAANCGSCGNACAAGDPCISGVCGCPLSGQHWCASASACIDTSTSLLHCGGCDKPCHSGEACSGGTCKCPTAGQLWCASAGRCVDTTVNMAHCGACDHACPALTTCVASACLCGSSGLTSCGNSCVDLNTDNNNCGSCNAACPGTSKCSYGHCRCPDGNLQTEVALSTGGTTSRTPSAVYDGAHIGVVWVEAPSEPSTGTAGVPGMNVYFTLLNPNGTRALVSDVVLTSVAATDWGVVGAPHLAWSGTEYAVVWRQRSPTTVNEWISLQKIGPDGVPKGAATDITAATSGSLKMGAYSPRIAWSPEYGGYAIAGTTGSQIQLQRLGATGTSPTAVTSVNITDNTPSYMNRVGFAVSPSQQWAVLARHSASATLYLFNADGSVTFAAVDMDTADVKGQVDLLHDGTDFHSVWSRAVESPSGVTMTSWHNRGVTKNAPYQLWTRNGPPAMGWYFSDTYLTRGVSSIGAGMLWVMPPYAGDWCMRFTSVGTASDLSDMGMPATITPGTVVPEASDLVQAGSTSTVMVWVDMRGSSYDLYARALMLGGCP
jgi:hypothetical protein